jgi:hypothetical protein
LPASLVETRRGVNPGAALASLHDGHPEGGEHHADSSVDDAIGYGGPCPPPGSGHRYNFTLYALDKALELEAGATRAELNRSMRGHILAEATLMGRYSRG